MHVDAAIRSRKSVRRFLPLSVPRHTVEHTLETAARAPSGNNVQPWQVHVVTGDAKQVMCSDILTAAREQPDQHEPEYRYYPDEWFEPTRGAVARWVSSFTKSSASPVATRSR